jgi:hypothetical protein
MGMPYYQPRFADSLTNANRTVIQIAIALGGQTDAKLPIDRFTHKKTSSQTAGEMIIYRFARG